MTVDVIVHRARELIEAAVADDLMALDVEGGHCYGFNATAARVWALTATPRPRAAICAILVAEYAVDPALCAAEVARVLDALAADGLVRLVPCAP